MDTHIANKIDNIFDSLPASYEMLNDKQLKEVALLSKIDEYKAQIVSHKKKQAFNIEEKIELWLSNKSHNSKRMYVNYLKYFISYLKDISILDVDSFELDKFNIYILNHFSTAKAKLIFSTVSSFYSDLVRWGDVDKNPCKGSKAHKDFYKQPPKKILPSQEDVEYLKLYYNKTTISHKKMRLAIYIMEKYGVRRDFFSNPIEYTGNFLNGFSKGKSYSVYVKDDEFIKDNNSLIEKINSNTIASNIAKTVNKLWIDGVISNKFSCHDFRHMCAKREYLKDKDIYRVCKLLNHSSINITINYLKGLEVGIDY